jgi:hypothetical protein
VSPDIWPEVEHVDFEAYSGTIPRFPEVHTNLFWRKESKQQMTLDQGKGLSFGRSSDAAGCSGRDPFGRGAEYLLGSVR